jgi:Transposase DDE domain
MGAAAVPAASPATTPAVMDRAVAGIEPFLEELLADLEPTPGAPPVGRPRILPSVCLWAGVLVCLLRGASTQSAVWRLLTHTQLWAYPRFALSDQAIYRRLDRESRSAPDAPSALERLFVQVGSLLRERLAPYVDQTLAPFAREVFAVDETTLDQIRRLLPALREVAAGADALFPGKLTAVFDLRRQLWHQVTHVPYVHQNEKASLPRLLEQFTAGVLLVFDLGYFSFAWFDALTDRQIWWVCRLRQKTSYTLVHVFYEQGDTLDALIWLGAYRADRAKHLVRLVTFRVGPVHYRYITNQLEPRLFSLRAIARVYQRRWDIELAFKLIKQYLHLHFLWSSKTHVLLAQIWGVLIISQVLQALRLQIAAEAGVDVFEVSLPLLVAYVPQYLAEGRDPVTAFVQDGRRLGFIRPSSRTENRAPHIPATALAPPPPDLVRVREPRYAERKTGPRPRQPALTRD